MTAQTLRRRHAAALDIVRRFLLIDDWHDDLIAPAELIRDARAVMDGKVQRVPQLAPEAGARFSHPLDGVTVDAQTGLMWTRKNVLPDAVNFNSAKAALSEFDLGGFRDWRLPTRAELVSLVDDTRRDPAIDTEHFACESSWYWASTPDAGVPEFAWGVNFSYGGSCFGHRDYDGGFVRACRSVVPSPGQ